MVLFFFYFPIKVAGENPRPPALDDNPVGVAKSKMYLKKKDGNSEGEKGFTIMEFRGHGGVTHFGISEGKGGLKHGSRLLLGMDIFWNCPLSNMFAIL